MNWTSSEHSLLETPPTGIAVLGTPPQITSPAVTSPVATSPVATVPSPVVTGGRAEPPDPRRIGNYRITGLLGSGGMGQIFSARHTSLDRPVAIKTLHPAVAHRTDYRMRLSREARLMARIHHPSVVRIYDFLELSSGDAIIMEWVEGDSLRALNRDSELQNLARVLSIAYQISDGLEATHRLGIVHRDVKSENVMLTGNGQVKLLDFGLAKEKQHVDPSADLGGPVMGTLRTMSPEQAKGLQLDERSDLFALGVLLYELLTGESPFLRADVGETLMRICTQSPRPLRGLQPDVPEELCQLLDRLLQKDPDARPQSAGEVAEILAQLEARCAGGDFQLHQATAGLEIPVCETTLPSVPSTRSA